MKIHVTISELKNKLSTEYICSPKDVIITYEDGTVISEESKLDCVKKTNEALMKFHDELKEKARNWTYDEFHDWRKTL